jgi:multimeric flavodoxin WrbA
MPKYVFYKLNKMIVILYDSESEEIQRLVSRIRNGIGNCETMSLDNVSYSLLGRADTIIFGCKSGFTPGLSLRMLHFMDRTQDRFLNQVWKNKFAAGFTIDEGSSSIQTLEGLFAFACKHSMIWIPQGHLEENEGHNRPTGTTVNRNKSYLGCIATLQNTDLTAETFGRRISQQTSRLLNPRQG